MKKTVIIRNEQIRDHLVETVQELPLDPVHEVIIKPHKRNRSLEQNNFYWKLLRIIAGDTGYTPEELHIEMKRRFLLPYLVSKEPELEEAALLHEDALAKVISTTTLNTKEMSDYIGQVERLALELGCRIPAREE